MATNNIAKLITNSSYRTVKTIAVKSLAKYVVAGKDSQKKFNEY